MSASTLVLTDTPQFCAVCHGMQPYHDAWATGPHANQWCVDCHVDSGPIARAAHKSVAVRQLQVQLFGTPAFPLATPPEVPSVRCERCHSALPATTDRGFPHNRHRSKACVECHFDTGHAVTAAALKSVGALAQGADSPQSQRQLSVRVGGGSADLRGHVRVVCSVCHKMGSTNCSTCHEPRHKNGASRGDYCDRCHKPGPKFEFSHSPAAGPCTNCHIGPIGAKAP